MKNLKNQNKHLHCVFTSKEIKNDTKKMSNSYKNCSCDTQLIKPSPALEIEANGCR